jgi:hypothetical protein
MGFLALALPFSFCFGFLAGGCTGRTCTSVSTSDESASYKEELFALFQKTNAPAFQPFAFVFASVFASWQGVAPVGLAGLVARRLNRIPIKKSCVPKNHKKWYLFFG